jgi:sec-independent protein translocase protein TatC
MALLERVLQRGPRRSPREVEDSRMTVIEHLEALRRVLIVSVIAWGVATLLAFFISDRLLDFLVHRAGLKEVIFLAPAGGFLVRLKVALYAGFVLAAPIVIQQLWWFVSPGLHAHERRFILPLIVATLFFFALGIGFALFALPLFIRVLNGLAPSDFKFFPAGDELLSFVLALVIGFGLVFELPVVLFVLGALRIISSHWLYTHRGYWIIGLGLLANVLTPGADPVTPLITFIPLYVFWEGTALLLKLTGR